MRIAIITRADDSSPKVLAQSLHTMLSFIGIECKVFLESGLLMRLVSANRFRDYNNLKQKVKGHYHRIKLKRSDSKTIKQLKEFDAIVFCECSPNGFWRNYYNTEKLKKLTGKPVIFYEVYYLGNAPTQRKRLESNNDYTIDRYDWYFSVSEVTEIRQEAGPEKKWTNIGLNLDKTNLNYTRKKTFTALIDFEQPGYEKYRKQQLEVLKKLNIPYTKLHGQYRIQRLREIYNDSAIYFIQSPEAFGVPIAEMLATGAYIFTPDNGWPMSWRLDEKPEIHGPGILPDIFKVYTGENELEEKLADLQNSWNCQSTPAYVFQRFTEVYPSFFYGKTDNLSAALERITHGK